MRTIPEERAVLLAKAHLIRSQKHFDQVMDLFPDDLREEVFAEVRPLLKAPLVLTPKTPAPLSRLDIGLKLNEV